MSAFLKFSWIKKSSQLLYFIQMYDDNNGRTIDNCMVLTNFLAQKTIEEKYFLNFFGFKKCL